MLMSHSPLDEKRGPYFAGWYLKHQTGSGNALALIPAMHIDAAGRRGASLQVIAGGQAWWIVSSRRFALRTLYSP